MTFQTTIRVASMLALAAMLTIGASRASADGTHDTTTGTMPMPTATHEAPEGMTVRLVATRDAKKGYNLNIRSTRFRWAPWNANRAHVDGQGHAHLYVDGTKVTRLYGPWYFLGDLTAGRHVIKVTLNGNDHGDYVRGTKALAATQVLTVA